MHVVRAKTAGFCLGVSLALRQLDAAIAMTAPGGLRRAGRLATLGPVIHNPGVIAAYEKKGVVCFDVPGQAHDGDTVLIRAHGVPRETEADLLARGATVIDATCPRVKQAQLAIAAERAGGGGTLLLYGEADHPEVKGLVSYAENSAHVFLNLEELEAIALDPARAYFLAAQTTQDVTGFEAVLGRVREKLGHDVAVLRTICDATRKRQAEVLELARHVDVMVVVGGSNSGNTKRLADVAAGQGVRVVRVEDASELDPAAFGGMHTAGVTAGASTPAQHIESVELWLKNL